jgi:hypothetical protein
MLNTVTSKDMQVWRSHRTAILSKIHRFCQAHGYPIITNLSLDQVPATSEKIVYMCIGDLIESYHNWTIFNTLCLEKQKTVFVITDNFYKYQNLSNIKFFAFTELNGVFFTDAPLDTSVSKSKLYNCFINRTESVRQSWFYFLYHYDLLDRGYVSLLMNNLESYSKYQGKDLFEYIHYKFGLDKLPHFENAYQAFKDLVPYQNFKEIGDLQPYITDSKYSLVLETCASETTEDQWHYSEKSMRALQQPTIPLLFVQSNGIALLKSLGFEMYADHSSIDNLPWQSRQQEILNILINDSIEYNQDRAIEICLHNRQVLKNMLLLAVREDYFDEFFNSVTAK